MTPPPNEPEAATAGDTEGDDQAFAHLLDYLRGTRGFDFGAYKTASLQRRVRRRMQDLDVPTFAMYLDYLEVHPNEFEQLFNTILINVTDFFRDRPAWEYLDAEILGPMLDAKRPEEAIRVWTAGVSSGQEAYTIAILLAERLGLEDFQQRVKIYATDVDEEALALARQAIYEERATKPLGELRDRYFTRANGRFEVIKGIRRAVIFGRHDLVQDAPISRTDLLVCRNTLMYFNADVQQRILSRFHFSLVEGGCLFLGKAETLLAHSRAFAPVNLKHRLFRKVPGMSPRDRGGTVSYRPFDAGAAPGDGLEHLRDLAFEGSPVAEVLVDADGIVSGANLRARLLFGLPEDVRGKPLRDLEMSYRPVEIRSLIEQAAETRREIALHEVAHEVNGEPARWFDVNVVPLSHSDELIGVNVRFIDVTQPRQLSDALAESKRQLEHTMEELQSSNEELETTNEELQSTVEELETTNEELQSTNEELETMNEELQSTNEELETVNDELRDRSDQINELNGFLHSILASLQMAVIVVDRDMNIQAWNEGAEELWGVRPEEAIGKHILNLEIGYPVEDLRIPLRACLSGTESDDAVELAQAVNRRGRAIQVRMTCSALRSSGGAIEGAILLMESVDHPD